MFEAYRILAALSLPDLQNLAVQLKFSPDPWAVGARMMVAVEISRAKRNLLMAP